MSFLSVRLRRSVLRGQSSDLPPWVEEAGD
jgi:hypothetical protein